MYLFSTPLVQTHVCFLRLWHEWSSVALCLPTDRGFTKQNLFPFSLFKFGFSIITDAVRLCTFLILPSEKIAKIHYAFTLLYFDCIKVLFLMSSLLHQEEENTFSQC